MGTLSHAPLFHHPLSNHRNQLYCSWSGRGSMDRITESERWWIYSLQCCTAWAQARDTQSRLGSVLPGKSCGCYVPMVSLEGCSSDHWANTTSDYRAMCRVPHNLSSIHGHLWELAGTRLINMPHELRLPQANLIILWPQRWWATQRTFSQGSQTISLVLYPILLRSELLCPTGTQCEPQM